MRRIIVSSFSSFPSILILLLSSAIWIDLSYNWCCSAQLIQEEEADNNKIDISSCRWGEHCSTSSSSSSNSDGDTKTNSSADITNNLSQPFSKSRPTTAILKTIYKAAVSPPSSPKQEKQQHDKEEEEEKREEDLSMPSISILTNEDTIATGSIMNNPSTLKVPKTYLNPTVNSVKSLGETKEPICLDGSNNKVVYHPPEGYTFSARVYTNPLDKLSYFDPDADAVKGEQQEQKRSAWSLPYLDECMSATATAMTTTVPLSLENAHFRHVSISSLSSSPPWETAAFTKSSPRTASLLVTLDENTILELNSGQSRIFPAGSVILMEDDIGTESHKFRRGTTTNNNDSEEEEVSILFLSLSQPDRGLVAVGKDETALKSLLPLSNNKKKKSCITTRRHHSFYSQRKLQKQFGLMFLAGSSGILLSALATFIQQRTMRDPLEMQLFFAPIVFAGFVSGAIKFLEYLTAKFTDTKYEYFDDPRYRKRQRQAAQTTTTDNTKSSTTSDNNDRYIVKGSILKAFFEKTNQALRY